MLVDDAPPPSAVASFAPLVVRHTWPVLVALPLLCSALMLTIPATGWWALSLAGIVYLFGFRAFETARHIDRVNREVGVALGRLGELNRAVEPGHPARAAELATALGRRLGLDHHELATVAMAARLHSAGLVGRHEAVVRPGLDHRALARWSKDIAGHLSHMDEVASLVGPDASGVLHGIVEMAVTYDRARCGMGMGPAEAFALVSRDAPPEDAAITAALGAELVDAGIDPSALERRTALAVDAVPEQARTPA